MMNICFDRLSGLRSGLVAASFLGLSACGAMQAPPTAQSIAGLTPVGTVAMTETVAAGMTGGTGSLTFQGRSYPFILIGSVVGPGGASRLDAVGEVYKLNNLSDFEGLYSEGTGQAGLDTSTRTELWLRNNTGVIMHLTGTSEGAVLSLGRSEVEIKLTR
ncbi:MAG: hypothetical protein RKO25_09235 [Candidatus Contendobacter sp.]|nr:hypothetical protein [Candidatus Contendobacter sp.]